MKITRSSFKTTFVGLIAMVLAIMASSSARAQILLYVDNSTPGLVVITPTLAGSSVPISESILDGISLVNLFQTNVDFTNFMPTSTLTTGDGSQGPVFNEAYGDWIIKAPYNQVNKLNLSVWGDSGDITFSTSQPAFSGSLSFNLSPSVGLNTSGAIVTGYNGTDTNTQIGTWELGSPDTITVTAPEPSTWLLLVGSAALLPLVRRFRRA